MHALVVFLRLASVYRKSGRFDEEQSILNEALLLGECGLFDPGINLAACKMTTAALARFMLFQLSDLQVTKIWLSVKWSAAC